MTKDQIISKYRQDRCKITDALNLSPEISTEDIVKKIQLLNKWVILERQEHAEHHKTDEA
jgi:hypothetical protein